MCDIVYICFCRDKSGAEYYGQGDSPEKALDDVISQKDESSFSDDLNFSEAVFYKANKLNLWVDVTPRIMSTT
jgi:hypothetical protein